jgi:hypothetical protein
MGWGELAGLSVARRSNGRVHEAVQEIRRDVQAASAGGEVCQADGGWRLRISVVVYIGGSVAEVLGVGVQCAGVFIFLALGKYAGLAPTF